MSITFTNSFSFATAQFGDILIIDNDTVWIFANPLEPYFEKKGSRTIGDHKMQGFCTALWRGYVATWKIENDSLFLVRIQADYCNENPTEIDMIPEFNSKRVHASWLNHALVRPYGEQLQYVHAGYMSIYEEDWIYEFEQGILHNIHKEIYLEKDEGKIFPGELHLSDTIRTMILSSINANERESVSEGQHCSLAIIFNRRGNIEEIKLSFGEEPKNILEKLIVSKAKIVLEGFPELMNVKHERYYPPIIELFFSGHCIKHPMDKEYGCRY